MASDHMCGSEAGDLPLRQLTCEGVHAIDERFEVVEVQLANAGHVVKGHVVCFPYPINILHPPNCSGH